MATSTGYPPQLTPIEGIRRELRRNIRSYITGRDERSSDVPAADGWFGPDSATWLIQSDWATLIGGVQSLIVQTLHPPTMAGFTDHSNYKSDPFGRVQRTANFIGVTTYGSAAEAERLVKVIRNVHERVVGTAPDGTPYSANDPHNLAWVHSTEVAGFLAGYRRYGAQPLSDHDADRYVSEMARVGEALGVIDAPQSVHELDERLESYLPELHCGAQARDALRWLLLAPNTRAAQGPFYIVLGAAVNLLPPWARKKLWLPPTIPYVSDAMVVPAAKALIKTFNWAMEPPEEIEDLRARRSA